jgi:hypothetical protein
MANVQTYHALYSDGRTYAVLYDAKDRKTYLATTDGGFMSVPYFMGTAEFVRYGFEYVPPKGLRGCDWWTNVSLLNAHLALLTPPAKPAVPSIPQTPEPEDFRLHVEPGGNFRTLQEAAMRVTAEYETSRQRARREMLGTMNEPNAQRIQDGRRINREFADMKRPHRQLKTSGE